MTAVTFDLNTANAGGPNLWEPHSISSLNNIRVQHVASGPSACHSIIICEGGTIMSFGMWCRVNN